MIKHRQELESLVRQAFKREKPVSAWGSAYGMWLTKGAVRDSAALQIELVLCLVTFLVWVVDGSEENTVWKRKGIMWGARGYVSRGA